MIIEKAFTRFFTAYGQKVAVSKPLAFVVFVTPIIITLCLGYSIRWMDETRYDDVIHGFTPENAESWYEADVIEEHWPLDPDEYMPGSSFNFDRFLELGNCPDGSSQACNMLEPKYLAAIGAVEKYVAENLSTIHNGVEYRYQNLANHSHSLCLGFWRRCDRAVRSEGPFSVLVNRKFYEKRGVHIGYPMVRPPSGTPVFLGYNIGGVKLDENDTISYMAAVRIFYPLRSDTPEWAQIASKFEALAMDYFSTEEFTNSSEAKLVLAKPTTSRSVASGLKAASDRLVPLFALTFGLLSAFCLLNMMETSTSGKTTIFGFRVFRLNWRRSKPWLAVAGITTALLGIISGFGTMQWLQIPFTDVCAVAPFLVISIGVDDMFILVAGWHSTNRSRPVPERIGHALGDAGVAITITSITSALSFGCGSLTTIKTVRLFCAYTASCIVFNYLYQVTFFTVCLVYFGYLEQNDRNAVCGCLKGQDRKQTERTIKPITNGKHERNNDNQPHSIGPACVARMQGGNNNNNNSNNNNSDTTPSVKQQLSKTADAKELRKKDVVNFDDDEVGAMAEFFHQLYGPALLRPITKLFVLLLLFIYLAGAIYGCAGIEQGLQLHKLLLADDPTAMSFHVKEKYFSTGCQVEVVFNNVPNMISSVERDKVEAIIREFESHPLCYGSEATQYWVRQYKDYMEDTRRIKLVDTPEMWVTGVRNWISLFAFYRTWGKDIAWKDAQDDNNSERYKTCNEFLCMSAFRLRVTLRSYETPHHVLEATETMRAIAARHPEYNVTTFAMFRQMADQMKEVLPATVKNIIIAMGCMGVISLIFIPNPFSALWIVLALISIDLGVAGYLSLWKVNLDQISMITIVMSIGLSIDFTAHIIYGYVTADSTLSADKRCIQSMERLAWPVFQGGISTVLGVSVLTFVDSYMILVFFKTVFLVVLFGVAHGLIFLPVLLSTVMPAVDRFWQCATASRRNVGKNNDEQTGNDAPEAATATNETQNGSDLKGVSPDDSL